MPVTPQEIVAEARALIKEAQPSEAQTMIENKAIVLDVREPAEFEQGHLPGAVHIPRGVLEFKVLDHPAMQDKDASVVCYCRTGGRSALAAVALEKLGYTKVVSMAGGITAWVEEQRQVEKDPAVCG